MADLFIFANQASSTLAGPISAGSTSLVVSSGDGALFPNPSPGQQFAATLNDAATGLLTEIIYCTARTVDSFDAISRGEEGTTPQSWIAGDIIANMLTAGQMAAMVQTIQVAPVRIVTASGAFSMTTSDANGHVGLNRTAGVGVSSSTLPSDAEAGQTYTVEDLAGNFQAFPCTINAPGGMSIGGLSSFVMNVNRQSATFTYYGSNIWGVDA